MKARTLLAVSGLIITMAVLGACHGAHVVWGTHEGHRAKDTTTPIAVPLPGTRAFGDVDFNNGAWVQLWKKVNAFDDPLGVPEARSNPDWRNDDELLDQTHVGYGIGPPGSEADGEFNRISCPLLNIHDVIYVRIYNVPKPPPGVNLPPGCDVSIRNSGGEIVSHSVTQVSFPERYFFDDLQTAPPPGAPWTLTLAIYPADSGKAKAEAVPPVSPAWNAPGSYEYDHGTVVPITAWNTGGLVFHHWEGPVSGRPTDADNSVIMNCDKHVTAVFAVSPTGPPPKCTLTLAVDPAAGGKTAPAARDYERNCGHVQHVLAIPNPGYVFGYWTGGVMGLPGERKNRVLMVEDKTVTAVFEEE